MILLRNFQKEDVLELRRCIYLDLTVKQVEDIICDWEKKQYNNRYFEMFAVVADEKIVGMLSLYQHSEETVSIGPKIFVEYRRKGFAKEAMICACWVAKQKGFKSVSQQIRVNNIASIELHRSLSFETNQIVCTNAKGNKVLIYSKYIV